MAVTEMSGDRPARFHLPDHSHSRVHTAAKAWENPLVLVLVMAQCCLGARLGELVGSSFCSMSSSCECPPGEHHPALCLTAEHGLDAQPCAASSAEGGHWGPGAAELAGCGAEAALPRC